MKSFKSHFKFNKQERSGIFFLLLIIIALQAIYYVVEAKPFNEKPSFEVNGIAESRLDSIKTLQKSTFRIFPFNPNYIDDYKGYALGMSIEELDRLFAFREKGSFVNSTKEFQQVTQISDSLLAEIAPLLKFPTWKQHTKSRKKEHQPANTDISLRDLNTATAQDLMVINGIGQTLSKRIVKFRDKLGGFLINEQLKDVYGLEPEVVKRALSRFQVLNPPKVDKININTATKTQLSKLVYINHNLAQQIVAHREAHGAFTSLNELTGVKTFPVERIERIKLYLTL